MVLGRGSRWKFYLLLLAAAVALGGWDAWLSLSGNGELAPVAVPAPAPAMPSHTEEEAAMLMERLGTPPVLTEEEQAEIIQWENGQMMRAKARLESPDLQERVSGAEQLSAYPSPEAEKLLADALAYDPAPEVQSAAARSLEFFKELNVHAQETLQYAVHSGNEEVAFAALHTLQGYVAREPYRSAKATAIINALKQIADSHAALENVELSLNSFLAEQTPQE